MVICIIYVSNINSIQSLVFFNAVKKRQRQENRKTQRDREIQIETEKERQRKKDREMAIKRKKDYRDKQIEKDKRQL